MPTNTLEPGDTTLLIPADDTKEYYATVTGASIQLGRTAHTASNEDRARDAPAGERGPMRSEDNEEVWAHNPDSNQAVARVHLDHNGFIFNREPRAVVGGVLTSSDNEAAPASDEYMHLSGRGVDVSASPVSESFEAPDAADDIVVSVDDADNSFEVAVVFEDADGTELTRRDSANSAEYSGESSSDVFVEALIAAPRVRLEITGAATSLDYTAYAR